ncbi:hypothetical protein GIB67_011678 [Kingdonia uniflora]|uniref:Uncharacterized protein n=1 Tax=Kingdonia uniflora TaxID=39325 RepID=A0A7J7LKJ9_9MAGN|nr:hypothetical protein GIB67_011678 [Kingdonia uniflora]
MCLLMQNLTMSLEEGEYDGTGDEEGSESDYSEGHFSQLHFLSRKKQKNNFEEPVNVSIEPPPPLPQNYEARDFRQLTQPDGNSHLSTSVATTSAQVGFKCKSVLVKLHKIYVIFIECCVPYPMNFKAILDVFVDSSSEEEEEEDIEQSSTNYSDDDVIDEIKLEILRNQAEIEELEEAKSLRTHVGSVIGHKTINRSRVFYNKLLMHDYFRDENVYESDNFRRRFRMSRGLFDRILNAVVAYDKFQIEDGIY